MPSFYAYARSSTSEQEDTLTGQEQRCLEEYTRRFKDTHERGQTFIDRGVSGSKRLFERPEGHRLLMALHSGDVVCVTKLDRGFRNIADFCAVVERLTAMQVRLVMLDMAGSQVDTGTLAGTLMAHVLAAFAEFERGRIRERTRDAVAVRRREGRPVSGSPPYGFRIDRSTKKKRLVVDPRIRANGREMLAWSDGGWSLDTIWAHLFMNQVYRIPPGRDGAGKPYTRCVIWDTIRNERRYQALEAQGLEVTAAVALALPRL